MVVCVNCGLEVPTLYHVYNKTNFCLSTCVHCGKISDKYLEWELPLMIIDLFLFKIEVYRHLIHNHSSRPFISGYSITSRINSTYIKVFLLLFSAAVLESYSMLNTCNYLTDTFDFCYPDFESFNKNALGKLATYFSSSFSNKQEPFEFKFEGISRSLGNEYRETVSELVENMATSMMHYSKLKIFKNRGLRDESCNRRYTRILGLFFLVLLQNPTLYTWTKNMTADCNDISEAGIMYLSVLRLSLYCLFISLLSCLLQKFGRFKSKSMKVKDCKCNSPDLHYSKVSMVNVVFALLLCFHIKALVLMTNIWYPRHTILIVIEFYIYLSHIFELNAICNISFLMSSIVVSSGALLKLGVYFIWFYFLNRWNMDYFFIK